MSHGDQLKIRRQAYGRDEDCRSAEVEYEKKVVAVVSVANGREKPAAVVIQVQDQRIAFLRIQISSSV